MKNNNKEGGFITLIVFIVVVLLIMKYFGITISGVVHWFSSFFGSVFK
jgi:hypothetical protein